MTSDQLKPRAEPPGVYVGYLIADNDERLRAFAAQIGLDPEGYLGTHYELSPAERKRAIAHGAITVSAYIAEAMIRAKRIAAGTRKAEPPIRFLSI